MWGRILKKEHLYFLVVYLPKINVNLVFYCLIHVLESPVCSPWWQHTVYSACAQTKWEPSPDTPSSGIWVLQLLSLYSCFLLSLKYGHWKLTVENSKGKNHLLNKMLRCLIHWATYLYLLKLKIILNFQICTLANFQNRLFICGCFLGKEKL